MATQDDNTILSKADLKAYHQKILPFLGGNAFLSTNHSDYYSTDEKMVGVWIDGKPLYQKTFSATTASNSSEKAVYDITGLNIVGVSQFRLAWQDGSDRGHVWDSRANGQSTSVDFYTRGNTLYIQTADSAFYGRELIATLQYTKSSDAAGSATATPGAYDLNRPDLWPANKEIFFGDGLYGQRFTGTYACSAATSSWNQAPTASVLLMSASKAYHLVQQGGGAARYNGTFFPLVGTDTDGSLGLAFWFGSDGIRLRAKDNNTNTSTYDVWCTYTK